MAASQGRAAAALPNLVLDPPGITLEEIEGDHVYLSPVSGGMYLLAEPGRGFDGRAVIVRAIPPGHPYGREGDTLASGLARSVTVRKPNDATLHLVSLRMSDQELAELAAAIDVTDEGKAEWTDGTLPAGLGGEAPPPFDNEPGSATTMFYGGKDGRLMFSVRSGGEAEFLVHLLGRLAAGVVDEVRRVEVAGRPGVLLAHDDRNSSLIWRLEEGVFGEVAALDLAPEQIVAAAETARALDDQTWRDIAAEHRAPGANTLEATTAEMCQIRARWLAARAAEDRTGQARAVADIDRLRDTSAASGLGARSDILIVLERLQEGMAGGDDATVNSIPAGGCP